MARAALKHGPGDGPSVCTVHVFSQRGVVSCQIKGLELEHTLRAS